MQADTLPPEEADWAPSNDDDEDDDAEGCMQADEDGLEWEDAVETAVFQVRVSRSVFLPCLCFFQVRVSSRALFIPGLCFFQVRVSSASVSSRLQVRVSFMVIFL